MVSYKLTNLGTVDEIGFVVDMNNSAQLVGYTPSQPSVAFLYSDGQVTNLTLPGFTTGSADGINNFGDVVGGCGNPPIGPGEVPPGHAFLYHHQNRSMTDLHLQWLQPAGYTSSEAYDINDQGMIVGDGDLGPWLIRDGKLTILRQVPGVPANSAWPVINYSGVVAFGTLDQSGLYRYDSKTNKSEFLGSFGVNVSISPPTVINDSGQIAGMYADKATGIPTDAYLYTQSLQALGITVDQVPVSWTPDLNFQGQMVFGTPSLYDSGLITNLQSSIPPNFLANVTTSWGAAFVNDGGQLLCYKYEPLLDWFFLTPLTPPPLPVDKIADLAAYVRVLFGVVEGGDGVVILPNGSIIRISPVGPPPGDPLKGTVFQLLSRLASVLALRESASTITDSKLRLEVQAAGAKLIHTSLKDALALLTNQALEEGGFLAELK